MSKSSFSFFLIILLLASASQAEASWYLNSRGQVVFQSSGQVLGDDDDKEEDHEDNSGKQEDGKQEDKNEDKEEDSHEDESNEEDRSGKDESEYKSETTDPTTGTKVKTEIKNGETHIEIKYADGSEYKYEDNDDQVEEEAVLRQNGAKIKLKQKNGKFVISTEGSDGDEHELGEDDSFEIEEDEDHSRIRVATSSGQTALFSRGKHAARTSFPLSVNTETNKLIVTTPLGEKTVTILPNAAIADMLAQNAFDRLGTRPITEAEQTNQIEGLDGVIELEEDEGSLQYQIEGISDQKLFGFFPIEIKRKVTVSAETGELLGTQESFVDRILDVLAF